MKYTTIKSVALALALLSTAPLGYAATLDEQPPTCNGHVFTDPKQYVQAMLRFCETEVGEEIRGILHKKIEELQSLHPHTEIEAFVSGAGWSALYFDPETDLEIIDLTLALTQLDLLSTTLQGWKDAEGNLALFPRNFVTFFGDFGAYYRYLHLKKQSSESGDSAYQYLLQQTYQPLLAIQASDAAENEAEQNARIDFVLNLPLYSLDTPEGHAFSIKAAHWAYTDFNSDPERARDCLEWVSVFTNFTYEPFAEIESTWTSIYQEISAFMVRSLDQNPGINFETSALQTAYQALVNHNAEDDVDEDAQKYTVPVPDLLEELKTYIGDSPDEDFAHHIANHDSSILADAVEASTQTYN